MRVFVALALVALASAATIPSTRTRVKGTFERSDFAAYKAKYGHSFSEEEENMRHENYLKTVATINAHNAEYDDGKHTWFMGENEFMHWTQEEFDNRNGYVQGSIKTDIPMYQPTGYAPAQKDWRQEGKVQYVKNQGQCGSCWCFGTVAAIEAYAAITTGMLPDASEQQLLDCAQGNGCGGGLPQYAYQYVAGQGQNGIDTQSSYPYTAQQGYCDTSKTQDGMNVAATIRGMQAVQGESSMREVVGNTGPVTVGVEANDAWKSYGGGIFNGPCGTQLNHAVAVVGYTSQAWIVKNSWGGSWGEGGYIMLAYGQNTCGVANDGSHPV